VTVGRQRAVDDDHVPIAVAAPPVNLAGQRLRAGFARGYEHRHIASGRGFNEGLHRMVCPALPIAPIANRDQPNRVATHEVVHGIRPPFAGTYVRGENGSMRGGYESSEKSSERLNRTFAVFSGTSEKALRPGDRLNGWFVSAASSSTKRPASSAGTAHLCVCH